MTYEICFPPVADVVVVVAFVTNHVCYLILKSTSIHTYIHTTGGHNGWHDRDNDVDTDTDTGNHNRSNSNNNNNTTKHVTICHSIKRPIQVHSYILLHFRKINLVATHFRYVCPCACMHVFVCVTHKYCMHL